MKVTVIGAGSWGTALALKSLQAGNDTILYCRRPEHATAMLRYRENREYLAGVTLPPTLKISDDCRQAVNLADVILIVTPSVYVRSTLMEIVTYIRESATVVLCSKGIERETGKRLSQVADEILAKVTDNIAILSGPNHAEEVGRNLPAATVVAAKRLATAEVVQQVLNSGTFRVYVNEDMTGVELAATTKNIIALAAGIADGMKLGDNAKAALLTRGLHEMTKLGIAMGARRETYAGLAGMGDLIATCMSKHSRNRAAGQKLADGMTMDDIVTHTNMVVEGFFAVAAVYEKAEQLGVELPITSALYDVLYHQKAPSEALWSLMARDLKDEMNI